MHPEIPPDTDSCDATCCVLIGCSTSTRLDHVFVGACVRARVRGDRHCWVNFIMDFFPNACGIREVFQGFQAHVGGVLNGGLRAYFAEHETCCSISNYGLVSIMYACVCVCDVYELVHQMIPYYHSHLRNIWCRYEFTGTHLVHDN